MLMFFNLVITPTMASRGIPTDAKPVEKESQVADAGGSISYRPLNPNNQLSPYLRAGHTRRVAITTAEDQLFPYLRHQMHQASSKNS
ncbi:hypothetical protein QJS10_CPA10g00600 [Acorus calamus]|uniref:Uncharacterized protein n=1 Tax=Acorus calamus TaxID=4465 RepID=A0AAV9DXM2_ACOCL|nr:hypothetical protein QJS10_CPA10g00600 [Acorus calamus]